MARWTREEVEELIRLYRLKTPLNVIAKKLNRSFDSVHNALKRYYGVRRLSLQHADLLDLPKEPTMEESIQYFLQVVNIMRQFDSRQIEVMAAYRGDYDYIGIVFQGDWHFEYYMSDLQSLVESLKKIGERKDVFYVFCGDIQDAVDFSKYNGQLGTITIPLGIRLKVIGYLLDYLPNILALVSGCHDKWVLEKTGIDIIEEIRRRRVERGYPTYYLGFGGTINFRCGDVNYRIAVRHKYGAESRTNIYHPCLKYLAEVDSEADIVVIAHRHSHFGIAFQYFQGKPRVLVRTGSLLSLTDYGWKEGFSTVIDHSPMVILSTKHKFMKACPNYKDGLKELEYLNRGSDVKKAN